MQSSWGEPPRPRRLPDSDPSPWESDALARRRSSGESHSVVLRTSSAASRSISGGCCASGQLSIRVVSNPRSRRCTCNGSTAELSDLVGRDGDVVGPGASISGDPRERDIGGVGAQSRCQYEEQVLEVVQCLHRETGVVHRRRQRLGGDVDDGLYECGDRAHRRLVGVAEDQRALQLMCRMLVRRQAGRGAADLEHRAVVGDEVPIAGSIATDTSQRVASRWIRARSMASRTRPCAGTCRRPHHDHRRVESASAGGSDMVGSRPTPRVSRCRWAPRGSAAGSRDDPRRRSTAGGVRN